MRDFAVAGVRLGTSVMSDAVRKTFDDPRVLSIVHGEDLDLGPWRGGVRRLAFSMNASSAVPVPPEVRRIVCGDRMRTSVRQKVVRSTDDVHEVQSRVRLHVLGAELLKIRPKFALTRVLSPASSVGEIEFSASVEVHAVFPSPLNRVIEAFMIAQSRHELEKYVALLTSPL